MIKNQARILFEYNSNYCILYDLKIGDSMNFDDQNHLEIMKKYRLGCKFFKIRNLPDEFWINFFYLAKRNKISHVYDYIGIASSTKHYKLHIKEKYPCDSFIEMPDQEKIIRYEEEESFYEEKQKQTQKKEQSKFIPIEIENHLTNEKENNENIVISVTTKNGSTIEIKNVKNPIEFLKGLL